MALFGAQSIEIFLNLQKNVTVGTVRTVPETKNR